MPEVDGIRFIAIFLVIAHHVSSYLMGYGPYAGRVAEAYHQYVFDFGARGVDLFFTLSGFILALPFARRYLDGRAPPSLRRYFLRRLLRLEPPLLIHLVLVGGARWFVTGIAGAALIEGFFGHAFYVSRIVDTYRLNVVLWSLEVEAQFYILAPLLATVYRVADQRTRRLVLLGLGVGLHMLAPFVFSNTDNFLHYALYFVTGMVVADYYVVAKVDAHPRQPSLGLDAAVLALLPAAVLVHNWKWAPELVLPAYCGLALVAALRGRICRRVLSTPVLAMIGGMCYTLYMYHYLVISVVGRVAVNWGTGLPYELFFAVQLLVQSAAILLLGAAAFRLTEQPFMRLASERLADRSRA
jgi:peptidoglycan/LPS O-acetylase OafA/YrhL